MSSGLWYVEGTARSAAVVADEADNGERVAASSPSWSPLAKALMAAGRETDILEHRLGVLPGTLSVSRQQVSFVTDQANFEGDVEACVTARTPCFAVTKARSSAWTLPTALMSLVEASLDGELMHSHEDASSALFAFRDTANKGAVLMALGVGASLVEQYSYRPLAIDPLVYEPIADGGPLWDSTKRWWFLLSPPAREKLLTLALEKGDQPLGVYHLPTVRQRARELKKHLSHISTLHYAIKANSDPVILRLLHEEGFHFECVSIHEVARVLEATGCSPDSILYTPNFAQRADYVHALKLGVQVTVDNTFCLEKWPEVFSGHGISLRMDPDEGHGHHKHVVTAGASSKFGITVAAIPEINDICAQHDVKIVGLHCHSGSGIFDPSVWETRGRFLASVFPSLPHLKFVDIGGGIGVPYKLSEKRIDLAKLNEKISSLVPDDRPNIALWMEPGRYLVGECGVLLTCVAQVKEKRDVRFIGVTAGMNHLLRPSLYSSHHEIVNFSKLAAPLKASDTRGDEAEVAEGDANGSVYQRCYGPEVPLANMTVCGPICETADIFGRERPLPEGTGPGDVILIDTYGAYGRVMASPYNDRPPAAQIFLDEESS